jgi:hypothetical protein
LQDSSSYFLSGEFSNRFNGKFMDLEHKEDEITLILDMRRE